MKDLGLFRYLLSIAIFRLCLAALAAIPALLAVGLIFLRLGQVAIINNPVVFYTIHIAFTFVFYKGITECIEKPENEPE